MNLARFADPQNVAVVAVFLRSEDTSQFIDSRLIVQIHNMPLDHLVIFQS
jgi:hypothetical protein